MLKSTTITLLLSCSILPAEESVKKTNLSLLVDWLYLQPNETGLAYAINNEDLDLSNDTLMGSGKAEQPKFDWNSGVRLGLDYTMPHDEWDLLFLWTWIEGNGDGFKQSKTETPTILPTFIHPNVYNSQTVAACISANADLFIHLNMLDLDLGKSFRASKSLSFRPHLGIRTAWLNQNYNIQYDALFDKTAELVLDEYSTSIKNNFWGIGILGGVGSEWDLKWGISLFGELSLSLLSGFFDTNYTEVYVTPTGASSVVISDSNNFRAGRAVSDLQLGLRWTQSYFKERFKMVLQGGWEHHMFFSQNQIMRFTDGQSWGIFLQNQGDVDFQGWAAALRLYF